MKKFCFIIAFILPAITMNGQNFPSWLQGVWEIPPAFQSTGSSFEEWVLEADGKTMSGKTYRIFGKDTIIFDRMTMQINNEKVVLKMSAQKSNQHIIGEYVGKMLEKDVWFFECENVDSPSAIYYRKLDDGSVYVWTEVKTANDICTEFTMYKRND